METEKNPNIPVSPLEDSQSRTIQGNKKDAQITQSLLDETQSNSINLDMAFQRVGGFGLFQLFATIQMAILRNAGMWCYNLFPYIVLP